MKVALYARVSSEKQAEKDLSLPAQIKALRDYALKRDWIIEREFIDEAESARTSDRPSFQQMISEAKQKNAPFEAILVWKLNRFARNREDSIIYKSLLRKRGVQVISINENFDDGPTGKLLEGIIESIDEFYSANLSQDTIRGMRENLMRGFWNGGCIPYGYENDFIQVGKNKKKKLKVIPSEAEVVKKVYRLCCEGKGLKEIVKTLNTEGIKRRSGKPWLVSNIAYILKNETYTGCLVWNEYRHNPRAKDPIIRIPDTHPAIISRETFQRARSLIRGRSREVIHPRALSSDHLLSSVLSCKRCGRSMASCSAKSGRFHYYTCQNYVKRGSAFCDQKLLNASKIEPFIIKLLRERVLTRENIRNLFLMINEEVATFERDYDGRIVQLDRSLEDTLTRRKKLYNGIETGKLDLGDVAPRLRELNAEIECLNQEKLELEKQKETRQPITMTESELKPFVDDLLEMLVQGTISERKGFIRSFVKRIYLDYPNIEIEYTVPLPDTSAKLVTREVLCIGQNGDPLGTSCETHNIKRLN